ncbi:MAG: MaoC family dehydratase [Anaerovoracaceae bacterium]
MNAPKRIDTFEIGDYASMETFVSEELINQIANLSGDRNPVHIDKEYAEKTIFKGKIAHGLLCLGMISNVLAGKLPGEGTILLDEKVKYKNPVYIGDKIKCTLTIMEKDISKSKLILKAECVNQNDDNVLLGQIEVKVI